jgi:glycosyltransferase involved in cell wall biosynthesis
MHLANSARYDFRVLRDATALVEAGYAVTIVDIESDRSRTAEEMINGVRLKHIFLPGYFVPARFKPWFLIKLATAALHAIIQLWRVRADIYHAHIEKALLASYTVARLRRKPLIFDAPEFPLSDPSVTRWRLLWALATRVFAGMLSNCAGVIATSTPTVRAMCATYHVSEVTLIRNIPTYQPVSKSDRLRRYLNLNPEVRIALYQGNLQPNRSLERLIYAASFLDPDIVIVMMGPDKEPTRSQLEALIASEKVADRVKIIPPAPYHELLDWTSSADIGLTIFTPNYSPNIRMTLPNKFFEYLMAGLPVLSSSIEAIAELIEAYDVGQVVTSLTPKDVGAAINSLFKDRSSLARMRRNALEATRNEFNWQRESQKLLDLYQDILATHSSRRTLSTPPTSEHATVNIQNT